MADTHAHAPKHSYHLVDPSPWPLVGALSAGLLATGGLFYMHGRIWWVLRMPAVRGISSSI